MTLTNELKTKNLKLFFGKLNELGVDTSLLEEKMSEKLFDAPFAMVGDSNMTSEGSLVHVVLRQLTPLALKINELLPENKRAKQESIIKVCLLNHISKALMYVKNDNAWEIEKRGLLYKYAKSEAALKIFTRSMYLVQEFGIKLTLDEFEAMLILDRDDNDSQTKLYATPLAVVIKQANELLRLVVQE